MAAPTYATDLQTYNDATSLTGWAEPTNMQSLDGTGVVDSDLAIYGTVCISESMRKAGLGALVYTGTQPTWTAGSTCYFAWFKWFAPNSLGTKVSQGGIRILVGNTSANYRGWYVDGSDTYAYGGWKNYVIDPTQTGLATQTQGTPTTTYNTVGIGVNAPVSSPSKGNSYTIDIIRYGRGEIRFTNGDLANGYATFNGMSLVNDNPTTGRWGLFQDQAGSYLWKGLMSLGLTATAVDFRDSNVVINIDNTQFVATNFNRIAVNNAASNVEWVSIVISSLGTRAKGQFEMVANATVFKDTCIFNDMDTFIYQSNASLLNCSYNRCGTVTAGGAGFTGCTFDSCVSASTTTTTDLANFLDCNFISDGSNHAITLTSLGSGSMNWKNDLEGYVVGAGGSPATTGATGNEAIFVNVATGTLTINSFAGYTVPSIRSAGAIVNVVVAPITTTLTAVDVDTGLAVPQARVFLYSSTNANYFYNTPVTSITRSGSVATVTHTGSTINIKTGDLIFIEGADQVEYNGTFSADTGGATTYTYTVTGTPTTPATGTILHTYVYFNDEADGNGQVTDTRSLSNNEPVLGRVRRATSGALYKNSPISATINQATGLDLTVNMISDE